jgi:hypothetical protein
MHGTGDWGCQPGENDGGTDIEPWLARVTLLVYPKIRTDVKTGRKAT